MRLSYRVISTAETLASLLFQFRNPIRQLAADAVAS